jgi:hypothetical protein
MFFPPYQVQIGRFSFLVSNPEAPNDSSHVGLDRGDVVPNVRIGSRQVFNEPRLLPAPGRAEPMPGAILSEPGAT